MKGLTSFLSVGTDEHGLKIQQAAAKAQTSPQAFCDRVSDSFKVLFDAAHVDYSVFARTTDARHAEAVAEIWRRLDEKGYIYKGTHEGWYAVSDEAYYTDGQVREVMEPATGKKYMASVETGQPVEWMTEDNYKFRLSAFQGPLLDWMKKDSQVIVPRNRFNEVKSWVENGLNDLSISRPSERLNWGISVPGDPSQTIYVWLDALTVYLTIAGFPWKQSTAHPMWPPSLQIIGKDILRFHAVYWPAFLMAAKIPLPSQILAHAHWTMGKQKMSKSRGNVANPFDVMKVFGVDAVRYYLMRDGGLADDGDYSDDNILGRYRKDLGGQLGNLLARSTAPSLNPSQKFRFDTAYTTPSGRDEKDLVSLMEALPDTVDMAFRHYEFGKGLQAVFDMLGEANRYFSAKEPWNLAKDPLQQGELDNVLFYAMEACRQSALCLLPVMPSKMNTLLDRLGVPASRRSWQHTAFGQGWEADGKDVSLGADTGVLFPPIKSI